MRARTLNKGIGQFLLSREAARGSRGLAQGGTPVQRLEFHDFASLCSLLFKAPLAGAIMDIGDPDAADKYHQTVSVVRPQYLVADGAHFWGLWLIHALRLSTGI